MPSSLSIASLSEVKASIAHLVLEDSSQVPEQLGRVRLQGHQQSAAVRLRSAIHEFGGAILCDPVGTGKTFSAIAVAAGSASVMVVAPAVLREMWSDAFGECDRVARFISFEALSRGIPCDDRCDFVIVDEAHHARNPLTKRFRMLSKLVAGRPVLLMTATPIHNRRSDLTALISLFLGERAGCLTSAELARVLIRRDELSTSIRGMPYAQSLRRMRISANHRMPELLLSLPPPLPVRDGSDGGVLIAHSLIRAWASSDAALAGGLRRRLVRAESLSAALTDGTWPTRAELISWITGDDAVQLGFAGLLASPASNTREMISVVRAHSDGLRGVLEVVLRSRSDFERADLIRDIRRAHPDRRIVAFSQYADTIQGLFRIISRDGRVGELTGSAARVAGGAISRSDAIATFAPRASHRTPSKASDDITLLLTTDLLSEGVNLQDAGVVIHLDLPWTPARMEQRLGRIARVGSRHKSVQSYAILPPLSAEGAIRIERILRSKIEESSLIVSEWTAFGGFDLPSAPPSAAQVNGAIRSILSKWNSKTRSSTEVVAAATAAENGFLAVVEYRACVRLVAALGERVSDDETFLLECVERITSVSASVDSNHLEQCERRAIEWIESSHALPSSRDTPIRIQASRRIARIVSRARAFERIRVAQQAEKALRVLSGNLGAFEESVIESALHDRDGDRILDTILAIGQSNRTAASSPPKVLAMIVLIPGMNSVSVAMKC